MRRSFRRRCTSTNNSFEVLGLIYVHRRISTSVHQQISGNNPDVAIIKDRNRELAATRLLCTSCPCPTRTDTGRGLYPAGSGRDPKHNPRSDRQLKKTNQNRSSRRF